MSKRQEATARRVAEVPEEEFGGIVASSYLSSSDGSQGRR